MKRTYYLASHLSELLATILIIPSLLHHPSTALAACECGYRVTSLDNNAGPLFAFAIETDFTLLTSLQRLTNAGDWIPQEYVVGSSASNGPYGKNASLNNVIFDKNTKENGLALMVRGVGTDDGRLKEGDLVEMSEIASVREDILYGTFRAGLKFTDVKGTCGAWFWYHNDTSELDIEYLSTQSSDNGTYPLDLDLQSPQHNSDHDPLFSTPSLPFNPTDTFHEYRIDWSPTSITYTVENTTMFKPSEGVPVAGGHLGLSHWSNGNKGWSAGPPNVDATMAVKWVRAYFNSSDEGTHTKWEKGCKKGGEVCVIEDGGAEGGKVPKFFNGGGKGTGMKNGNGKAPDRNAVMGLKGQTRSGFWILVNLATLLMVIKGLV